MNMIDYSTLYLDTNYRNSTFIAILHFGHNRVFNNEHKSYTFWFSSPEPQPNLNGPLSKLSSDLALHPRCLLNGWKIWNLWKFPEPVDGIKPNTPWVGPLPKLCPLIWSIIQDSHHSRLYNFWLSSIISSFWHLI